MGVKIPTQLLIDLCPLVDVASLALVTYKRTNHKHSIWKTHKKSHLKIASFGCIKSGEKFIKNAKNVQFGEFLKSEAVKQCYQTG